MQNSGRIVPGLQVRQGLTIVELLVTIAIVGLLVAMLLPAVQRSRAAARTATCRSHLRQIGIASQQYLEVHSQFPWYVSGGWLYSILPFVEQGELYDTLDQIPPQQRSDAIPRIAVYLCPDDTTKRDRDVSSYAVNTGLPAALGDFQGFVYEPVDANSVTDGLSQTVMFSEYVSNSVVQSFDVPKQVPPLRLSHDQLAQFAADCRSAPTRQSPRVTGGESGPVLSWPGGYNHILPPYSPTCLFNPHPAHAHTAFSHHAGGVNALSADGSVHFVASSIDREVWASLGTISGNDHASW